MRYACGSSRRIILPSDYGSSVLINGKICFAEAVEASPVSWEEPVSTTPPVISHDSEPSSLAREVIPARPWKKMNVHTYVGPLGVCQRPDCNQPGRVKCIDCGLASYCSSQCLKADAARHSMSCYRDMDPGLEERLRRRSREMGFDPYLDTPFRDPALHAEDVSSDPPPPDSPDFHDDGNDHGCDCGLCGPMPTALEQVCCRDIPQVLRESPDGCITQHEEFRSVCLSSAVLRALYCELQENGVAVEEVHR
ncbi:hypothetical protein MTO96_011491 [Rhipicephalus appendiculatus]